MIRSRRTSKRRLRFLWLLARWMDGFDHSDPQLPQSEGVYQAPARDQESRGARVRPQGQYCVDRLGGLAQAGRVWRGDRCSRAGRWSFAQARNGLDWPPLPPAAHRATAAQGRTTVRGTRPAGSARAVAKSPAWAARVPKRLLLESPSIVARVGVGAPGQGA